MTVDTRSQEHLDSKARTPADVPAPTDGTSASDAAVDAAYVMAASAETAVVHAEEVA